MSRTDSWNSASVWERAETVRETENQPATLWGLMLGCAISVRCEPFQKWHLNDRCKLLVAGCIRMKAEPI